MLRARETPWWSVHDTGIVLWLNRFLRETLAAVPKACLYVLRSEIKQRRGLGGWHRALKLPQHEIRAPLPLALARHPVVEYVQQEHVLRRT